MRTPLRIFLYAMALGLLLHLSPVAQVVYAQSQAAAADLTGAVKDPTGAVISGVKIVVRNPQTGLERTVTSNEEGEYRLFALPPGSYELMASATGFGNYMTSFTLTVGTTGILNIPLSIAGGTEIIEVTATKVVDSVATAVTQTVESQRIDNLPINGRNFLLLG
jgi:hypothetical protein